MSLNLAIAPPAITPAMKRKLEGIASICTFKEGEVILDQNANIRYIPIVISGAIRVMRTDEEGRELLIYYIKPGESCIMSFLGGIHRETSKIKAIAEEEVEIYLIPLEKLSLMIKENTDWMDYIFRLYHKRFDDLLEVVNALAFRHIDDRIYVYLKEKANLTGSNELQLTHQHIADEIGTSRVVVSRLLKQMETAGQVRLGRNKISLL